MYCRTQDSNSGKLGYRDKAFKVDKELQQSLEDLPEMLDETVQAIALLCEVRDPYTAAHQRRVAQLAYAIAAKMGLSEKQNQGTHTAAYIHDIGKVAVPTDILNKPGELNGHEFSIIKSHSEIAYDVLKGLKFPWPVAQAIFQHHEKLDGSGYPQGLCGKEIILEARILGVADVVEAIASHRPYRPSLGINKALEEISKNKGILYDADVVDSCVRLFAEKVFRFA